MHDLVAQTALGGQTARTEIIGGLTIAEVPDIALASVAARLGQESTCAAALKDMLGGPPPEVGRCFFGTPVDAFWTAQDQWMLMADHGTQEVLAAHVKDTLGSCASVTEQNDGWVCFDISGDKVVALFERLCPVAIHRMQKGDAQRTTLHHIGCFILCLEAGQSIRLLGPRSFAESLNHALCVAARSLN